MRIRYVSPVVFAVATCIMWSCFAAGADNQETSNPKDTSTATVTATEPVQLSASAQDILKLSRAKVGEDVIIAFVQGHSRHFDLTASEIVHLRENGVSDRVLAAMVNQPSPAAPASQSPAQPTAPATAASVSASQDAAGNPPAATVYVVPPSAPYAYAPYPYYGYSYPAFSVGLAFGTGWGYGYYGGCYRGDYYYGRPYGGGYSHGGHLTVVGGHGGGYHGSGGLSVSGGGGGHHR